MFSIAIYKIIDTIKMHLISEFRKAFKARLNSLIPHGEARHIARRIFVEEGTLSAWRSLKKTNIPSLAEAVRLAEALGVSVSELAGMDSASDTVHLPSFKRLLNLATDMSAVKLAEVAELVKVVESYDVETLRLLRNACARLVPRKDGT